MAGDQIGVAEFIRQLRSDLETSMAEGEGKALRFDVEELDVELQVTATFDTEAGGASKGGLKLWLLSGEASAAAKAAYAKSQVQIVRLKLKAFQDDGQGGRKRAKLKGKVS